MSNPSHLPPVNCWVLLDGRRGHENQALGLAQSLARLHDITLKTHRLNVNPLLSALPVPLQRPLGAQLTRYGFEADIKKADIIIGCGRQTIAPLRQIKRAYPDCFTVYIQNPQIAAEHFDLVIAPRHDDLSGPNVEAAIGSPSKITPQTLKDSAQYFSERLEAFPRPQAAILIGGPSKIYSLPPIAVDNHIHHAQRLLDAGYSLLISTSRRTPAHARQKWKALTERNSEHIWFYDALDNPHETKPDIITNPYPAFLSSAEIILVTQESTNMLTEACLTGKTVFTLEMHENRKYRHKTHKFRAFHQSLNNRCHIAPFTYPFEPRSYEPLNETPLLALKLWQRFLSHKSAYPQTPQKA